MTHRPPTRTGRSDGFTLIEIVVAMLIIAILGTIALSSYINQSRKSRRTEARTALLDLAGREERNFSTRNAYSQLQDELGYSATAATPFPVTVGSGYYSVNVTVTAAVPGPPSVPASYTITATAIGDQLKDTACRTFTLDSTGLQTAITSGGAATTTCW